MPTHFEAFLKDEKAEKLAADIYMAANDSQVIYASKEKLIIHMYKELTDSIRQEPFGRVVYTVRIDEESKSLSIIDVDIVLDNDRLTKLELIEKLPKSSDANEYYEAAIVDDVGHLQIETVNRHAFEGELEGCEHDFHLSAFPFVVKVYDSMDEINKRANVCSTIMVDGEKRTIGGFAEDFICPASFLQGEDNADETYTYFFGKVNGIRNVECRDFSEPFSFYIVDVVCGLGVIPLAMSPECFDLSDLAIGKVVQVKADIKADLGNYAKGDY